MTKRTIPPEIKDWLAEQAKLKRSQRDVALELLAKLYPEATENARSEFSPWTADEIRWAVNAYESARQRERARVRKLAEGQKPLTAENVAEGLTSLGESMRPHELKGPREAQEGTRRADTFPSLTPTAETPQEASCAQPEASLEQPALDYVAAEAARPKIDYTSVVERTLKRWIEREHRLGDLEDLAEVAEAIGHPLPREFARRREELLASPSPSVHSADDLRRYFDHVASGGRRLSPEAENDIAFHYAVGAWGDEIGKVKPFVVEDGESALKTYGRYFRHVAAGGARLSEDAEDALFTLAVESAKDERKEGRRMYEPNAELHGMTEAERDQQKARVEQLAAELEVLRSENARLVLGNGGEPAFAPRLEQALAEGISVQTEMGRKVYESLLALYNGQKTTEELIRMLAASTQQADLVAAKDAQIETLQQYVAHLQRQVGAA